MTEANPTSEAFGSELDRARRTYAGVAMTGGGGIYDPLRATALFRLQEREWALAALLRRAGVETLTGLDTLEVGCGSGGALRRLMALGAEPARMAGIDLMEARIEAARELLPQAEFHVGSAHNLPFSDASFDVVLQATLFSSVVDPDLQLAIAAEMVRVLRPSGVLVWYDMHRVAQSSNIVPMGIDRIRELFGGAKIDVRSVTLRWWLGQRVPRVSRAIALALQQVPFCCSHYLAVIRPKR